MPVLRPPNTKHQSMASRASSTVKRNRPVKKKIDPSSFSPSGPGPSRQRETKSKGTLKRSSSNPFPDCEVIEISSDEENDTANSNQSTLMSDLHKQIAQLKDENSKLQHDLERKYATLKGKILLDATEIEDNTSCEICAMKMWSPCLLTDCGHIFCQSCLQDWFGTILINFMADHPGYSQRQLNEVAQLRAMQPMIIDRLSPPFPQYSCPVCRKTARTKPMEVYALKALVRVVASATGERSPQKDSSARNGKKRNSPTGVWDRFFPAPI